jgi:hypothetical protein
MTSAVAAAGLLLDIVGATILVVGVALKRPSDAVEEATLKYDVNAAADLAIAKQTADAQVGAALLALGFLGQLIAALGVNPTGPLAFGLAFGAAAVVAAGAVVGLLLVWRPRRAKRALWWRLSRTEMEQWPTVIEAYARELVGIREGPVPTPAERAVELMGERRWRSLVPDDERLPEPMRVSWHPSHVRGGEDVRPSPY